MGDVTKIQWTDATFNPWVGCTKVAPGCANCYAEADMDKRRHFAQWGPNGTRVRTSDANWKKPHKWNREAMATGVRRRVFCSSLADVFEDWKGPIVEHSGQMLTVSDQEPGRHCPMVEGGLSSMEPWQRRDYEKGGYRPTTMSDLRGDLFRLIDKTPWLDWQLLTKRPANIPEFWPARSDFEYIPEAGSLNEFNEYHRDNVWIGTSVSEQGTADENIPLLLHSARLARVLFVSAEPLLGPIDLRVLQHQGIYEVNALTGTHGVTRPLQGAGPAINWVIIGGESGADARKCMVEWGNSLQAQCQDAGVAVFRKQLGAVPYHGEEFPAWPEPAGLFDPRTEPNGEGQYRIHLRDPKGGDCLEWPAEWRVRQLPKY